MHRFLLGLITEWRKLGLPFSGAKVVAAVSGGADSTALIAALVELRRRKKLKLDIAAAHFDHRLRGAESDADEEFVRSLAESLGVSYICGQMKRPGRANLEQFARRERYAFLEQTADSFGAAFVLTSHTKNDQAETFLINLLRGSGIDGLAAMPTIRSIRPDSAVSLVRPMLSWAVREDTEAFCREAGTGFRTDAMNADPRFTRVRVRRELLPLLREFNPKIVDTLARTAGLLAGVPPADVSPLPASPTVRELRGLPHAAAAEALRQWLKEQRGNLNSVTATHIDAVIYLVASTKSGTTAQLPGGSVVKRRGRISWVPSNK